MGRGGGSTCRNGGNGRRGDRGAGAGVAVAVAVGLWGVVGCLRRDGPAARGLKSIPTELEHLVDRGIGGRVVMKVWSMTTN